MTKKKSSSKLVTKRPATESANHSLKPTTSGTPTPKVKPPKPVTNKKG